MIKISTSENCEKEKKYIFSCIFKDFLGIDYFLEFKNDCENYLIEYNTKSIIIEDHFFSKFQSNEYINTDNIPKSINYFNKTPIIYGNNDFKKEDNNITLGLDIFASAFFMLTRWEEIANNNKDSHDRFLTNESLAFNNNFHRQPIVNEYIEILWSLLLSIAYPETNRKKRTFKYKFSHDVDHPKLFTSFKGFIKQISYQTIKKRNIKESIKFAKNYLSKSKDPYNTFDLLMDISEKNNTKSQFNFMACSKSKYDEGYDLNSKFNQNLISRIKERNHDIGFHPSYNTYKNASLWEKEKDNLEKIINQEINKGRQHYLRFENPTTLNIWEDNKMLEDSTIGFADEVGFRAGICYSYYPFDVINRKKLNVLENPLVLMEGALINSINASPEEFVEIKNYFEKEIRKYNGTFTILWHNSSFFLKEYLPYEKVLFD